MFSSHSQQQKTSNQKKTSKSIVSTFVRPCVLASTVSLLLLWSSPSLWIFCHSFSIKSRPKLMEIITFFTFCSISKKKTLWYVSTYERTTYRWPIRIQLKRFRRARKKNSRFVVFPTAMPPALTRCSCGLLSIKRDFRKK